MLLVRHGETEANAGRVYHGRLDSPLTGRGVRQAEAIGRQIAGLAHAGPFRIVASPLPRARRTAEIIRDCLGDGASALSLDDRLCEVSIGGWEGCSHQEIETLSPGVFHGDGRYEWCFRAPEGEPYESFSARIENWLRESDGDPNLIVVTHGIVARVLRGLYTGLPRLAPACPGLPRCRCRSRRTGSTGFRTAPSKRSSSKGAPATIRLAKVTPLPGYRLLVQFEDGVHGTIDVRARLPSSSALQDEKAFQRVTVDDFNTICWPGGPPLSAERAHEWVTAAPDLTESQ